MEIQSFQFAKGFVFQSGANNADPEMVGRHLEGLRARNDSILTPEIVLDDAKDEASPLHPFFEWDDTEAARKYRLQQAGYVIRSVVAIYKESPTREPMRAYVHVRTENAPARYMETSAALASKPTRDAVLRRAKAELDAWRRRYADLQELAEVVAMIGLIGDRIEDLVIAASRPESHGEARTPAQPTQ